MRDVVWGDFVPISLKGQCQQLLKDEIIQHLGEIEEQLYSDIIKNFGKIVFAMTKIVKSINFHK